MNQAQNAQTKIKQLDKLNLKTLPYSHEAEQSVLGGLMINANGWDQIADLITGDDFYHNPHRLIYRTMAEMVMNDQILDYIALSDVLKAKRQMVAIGGESYLLEMQRNTPSAANILTYAQIIRKYSVQRQLIQASNEIATSAFDTRGRDFSDLLDEAERKIFAIAEQSKRIKNQGPQPISTILASTLEQIEDNQLKQNGMTGLSTGFIDLDRKISGLQKAEFIILAGRPSMGKTAFALNMAENMVAAWSRSKSSLIRGMAYLSVTVFALRLR